jgi:sulfatase modifying factor 1
MADASEPRRSGPLRLHAILLPRWSVISLSALLVAGAVGLPWLATWQGALRREEASGKATGKASEPALVQLRPELVVLPGGTFMMGSSAAGPERVENEDQHEATVRSFAICRTEVTLSQWQAVMGTRPSSCDEGCDDDHPVQRVSWNDALRYLNRLTEMENEMQPAGTTPLTPCYKESAGSWSWSRSCTGYRLPTEVEWEYAARAETQTAYSFGDDAKEICAYGNGSDQAASLLTVSRKPCDDGYAHLAPVGTFIGNKWGLYDVHGNVREWVWDGYGVYPERAEVGYAGSSEGTSRVVRGGSFADEPTWLRSSFRGWASPPLARADTGFRCVRDTLAP